MNNVVEEIWKDIEEYEGIYQVSNHGRIKSMIGWNGHKYIKREKMLNPYKQEGSKNYYRAIVKLKKDGKGKEFKVHRLVAEAFIPNPENKAEVNHLDGNPLNNIVSNLEWSTHQENITHSIDTGLKVNTINTIDRKTMVTFLNNGYNYDEIADILGIAKGTVFNYIRRFDIKKIYK